MGGGIRRFGTAVSRYLQARTELLKDERFDLADAFKTEAIARSDIFERFDFVGVYPNGR